MQIREKSSQQYGFNHQCFRKCRPNVCKDVHCSQTFLRFLFQRHSTLWNTSFLPKTHIDLSLNINLTSVKSHHFLIGYCLHSNIAVKPNNEVSRIKRTIPLFFQEWASLDYLSWCSWHMIKVLHKYAPPPQLRNTHSPNRGGSHLNHVRFNISL